MSDDPDVVDPPATGSWLRRHRVVLGLGAGLVLIFLVLGWVRS